MASWLFHGFSILMVLYTLESTYQLSYYITAVLAILSTLQLFQPTSAPWEAMCLQKTYKEKRRIQCLACLECFSFDTVRIMFLLANAIKIEYVSSIMALSLILFYLQCSLVYFREQQINLVSLLPSTPGVSKSFLLFTVGNMGRYPPGH